MRDIWELQHRLDKRAGKRAIRLVEHARFRAAYDFLLLREASGEIEAGLGDWWTKYQEVDQAERASMANALLSSNPRKKRRRRKPSAGTAQS